MRLTALLGQYALDHHQIRDRTIAEYRGTIAAFGRHLGREPELVDLNDQAIKSFVKARLRDRSPATARKDRQQILALWGWAWRTSVTETAPRDTPTVSVPRKTIRAWRLHEVTAILAACDRANTQADGWGPRHWRALVLTIYDTAERIDALLRCPLSGLDTRSRTLHIPASVRKRGMADQLATLHADTVEAIEDMLDVRRDHSLTLFGSQAARCTIYRRFRTVIRDAGLDPTGRKPFHDLRRTSFTLTFLALGREAARRQCGHTTDLSRYYLDEALLAELSPDRRVADSIRRPTEERNVSDEAVQGRHHRGERSPDYAGYGRAG